MTIRASVAWLAPPVIGAYLGVLSLGAVSMLAGRVLPATETAISPIVAFSPVDGIRRDKDKVCFLLHIAKLHAAVPIKYAFFVEAHLSDRIPVAAYLVDDDLRRQKNADLTTHPVGERWTRHYCFDLPQTIGDLDVRVTGFALHRRHPLWNTPTPIPSFTVAGFSSP